MSDDDDKFICRTITITPKGRRWVELIQKEGLTPDEAMRRIDAEDEAQRNPQ